MYLLFCCLWFACCFRLFVIIWLLCITFVGFWRCGLVDLRWDVGVFFCVRFLFACFYEFTDGLGCDCFSLLFVGLFETVVCVGLVDL